ncbi:hypothetical protein BH23ACT5_BH23ACT5_05420 [soil metagenome]
MESVVAPTWPLVNRDSLRDARGPVMILAPGQAPVELTTPPLDGAQARTRPVTEAMKRVADGRVVASIDRDGLVEPALPLYLSESTLARLLASNTDDPIDVLEVLAELGDPVTVLAVNP